MKILTFLTPRRQRTLSISSRFIALFPSTSNNPKPRGLSAAVGLDSQSYVHRPLAGFPSADGEEGLIQEHRVVAFVQRTLPPSAHFFFGYLGKAEDAMG